MMSKIVVKTILKIYLTFSKTALGINDVQALEFLVILFLVAYALEVAGFLFHKRFMLDQREIRLLDILGGWVEHTNRI